MSPIFTIEKINGAVSSFRLKNDPLAPPRLSFDEFMKGPTHALLSTSKKEGAEMETPEEKRERRKFLAAFHKIVKLLLDGDMGIISYDHVREAAELHAKHGDDQHYEIWSRYLDRDRPTGCTTGAVGLASVLSEDLKDRFTPVEKKVCRNCKETNE